MKYWKISAALDKLSAPTQVWLSIPAGNPDIYALKAKKLIAESR
jgi:6-phosphogluconate dehydrogenase (decarboxylating)